MGFYLLVDPNGNSFPVPTLSVPFEGEYKLPPSMGSLGVGELHNCIGTTSLCHSRKFLLYMSKGFVLTRDVCFYFSTVLKRALNGPLSKEDVLLNI
jgi:hypothetical protein